MPTPFANGADLKNRPIINLGPGSNPNDAVNFQQLQDRVSGLDMKDPVRVATTAAITLSGTQTIDGIAVAAGDRVLVKNQTDATTNGIYVVSATAWARAADADASTEVTSGLATTVLEGTTKGTGTALTNLLTWTLTNTGTITLGTTALNFAPHAGGGGATYTEGDGINIVSNAISVEVKAGGGLGLDAGGVFVGATIPRKFAASVGDGTATSFTLTHNLGTLDFSVTLVEAATGVEWVADVTARSTTAVTLVFATAPAANAFRVVVMG